MNPKMLLFGSMIMIITGCLGKEYNEAYCGLVLLWIALSVFTNYNRKIKSQLHELRNRIFELEKRGK